MIRSHHITLALGRERHRDLADAGASGSRAARTEPSTAPIERHDILATVRGDASGFGPAAEAEAEAGAAPVPSPSPESLRARRTGEGPRFVREQAPGHRGSAPAGGRRREPVR